MDKIPEEILSEEATRILIETITRVVPRAVEWNAAQYFLQHYPEDDWARRAILKHLRETF